MVSLPLFLQPRSAGLTRWMELLCDGVLELVPLDSSLPPVSSSSSSSSASAAAVATAAVATTAVASAAVASGVVFVEPEIHGDIGVNRDDWI